MCRFQSWFAIDHLHTPVWFALVHGGSKFAAAHWLAIKSITSLRLALSVAAALANMLLAAVLRLLCFDILQFTFLQDDIGIPLNYRHMEGFGVHTFTLINKEGKITYVKFHWKPTCGVKNLLEEEAVTVGGSNHSHATKVSLVLGFT